MTTARPTPSARRRGHALAGMALACALILLAACGGGSGGGGDAAFKLRLAITNETAESATVTLAVAPGRNLAVLVEAAVRNTILMTRGIDSTRDFISRQAAAMRPGEPDDRDPRGE
mgnify:CR=1 FL=1